MKKYITKQTISIVLKLMLTALLVGILSLLIDESNEDKYMVETAHKYNYENYLSGNEAFITIEQEGLETTEEINEFYSTKSSGKVDIEMACTDDRIKEVLFSEFGEIVNIGCRGHTRELKWN